jgi:hypothetical protein
VSQAYQRVLGRVPCPRCQQENVPVMANFKLYGHGGCLGAPAELVFTAMLRLLGLDVRPDSTQSGFPDGVDYDAIAEQRAASPRLRSAER